MVKIESKPTVATKKKKVFSETSKSDSDSERSKSSLNKRHVQNQEERKP